MTNSQQKRIKQWYSSMSKLPQWQAYGWWLKLLDLVMPCSCPFEKTYHVANVLICYIPKLCMLNPWYDSLIEYRFGDMKPIEKGELFDNV